MGQIAFKKYILYCIFFLASNVYVLGGIDPHTHFELELMGATSVDDFYQGTKAAIAGGTTMISEYCVLFQ